jgi:signal transduction histidine kinase
MIWLQTHGITFTPNFVPGKHLKYKWAKPDTLIIDDTLSVIEDWRKAGGVAIWHKDVPTTLAQLNMYI